MDTIRTIGNRDDRVTWLLPVRNGIAFLREALASIEGQTYQNWEVIARDDGSTDGTLDELQKWIPGRLPGKILSGPAVGLGRSLAELVEHASTELCARMDGDDINTPDRLEKQVPFLRAHPEIAIVGGQMEVIDENSVSRGPWGPLPINDTEMVHLLLYTSPLAHPTVLFRRAAVLAVGNYRYVGPITVEDYDLWLRLAVTHRLANLSDVVLKYRIHTNSSTQKALAENALFSAGRERLCEHAPVLFGCASAEIKTLAEKKQRFALRTLYKIARQLASRHGRTVGEELRTPSFRSAAEQLIAERDFLTRRALRLWASPVCPF